MWQLIRAELSYRREAILFGFLPALAASAGLTYALRRADQVEAGPFLLLFVPHLINAVGWSYDKKEHRLRLLATLPLKPHEVAVGRIVLPTSLQLVAGALAALMMAWALRQGAPESVSSPWQMLAISGFLLLSQQAYTVYQEIHSRIGSGPWRAGLIGVPCFVLGGWGLYVAGLLPFGFDLLPLGTLLGRSLGALSEVSGAVSIHAVCFLALAAHVALFGRRRSFIESADICW